MAPQKARKRKQDKALVKKRPVTVDDDAIAVLEPMYQKLLQQERAVGPDAAWKQWEQELATQQHDYESLMLALYQKSRGQQQKANR